MPTVTFDGNNLLITIGYDGPVTSIDAEEIYSAWKIWVQNGNANFPAAFSTIGGESIGTGLEVAPYYFLQNQVGWRIRPAEQDHDLAIIGNLYPGAPATRMVNPTVGDFTVLVSIERSSAAIAIETGGGGAIDPNDIADAVWDATQSAHLDTGTTGKTLQDAKIQAQNAFAASIIAGTSCGNGDGSGFSQNFTTLQASTGPIVVTHNLGFIPAGIIVIDSAGDQVFVSVDHMSINQLELDLTATPFAGTIYLS